MDKYYVITERDYYMLQAMAEWAEVQGQQVTANMLRDMVARSNTYEDVQEHGAFPVEARRRW